MPGRGEVDANEGEQAPDSEGRADVIGERETSDEADRTDRGDVIAGIARRVLTMLKNRVGSAFCWPMERRCALHQVARPCRADGGDQERGLVMAKSLAPPMRPAVWTYAVSMSGKAARGGQQSCAR